jgi:transposase
MNELNAHYGLLLGLNDSWEVVEVNVDPEGRLVEIQLRHRGGKLVCPDCQQACPQADLAAERTWRHLDLMQFETRIRARVPRCDCEQCGVKTTAVPWAGKHSRFTLLFEAFAIKVLTACSSVKRAAELLKLDWDTVHSIMSRAVERGLRRRSVEEVQHVGMDEKSFLSGHNYVSVLTDLDESRVLEVVPGRTEESATELWKSLPESQRKQIRAIAMDMWPAFIQAAEQMVPKADIVFDKFHVSKHLNEAVDTVRRQEQKRLLQEDDSSLTGTRQLWLYAPRNLSEDQQARFEQVKHSDLKTAKAWAIKENFRVFWTYHNTYGARQFFKRWFGWAARCQLTPVTKVAKMIHRHLENLLTYCRHKITNAVSEGLNSRVQSIKSAARGFRQFANYRTRILFYCGKLDLAP